MANAQLSNSCSFGEGSFYPGVRGILSAVDRGLLSEGGFVRWEFVGLQLVYLHSAVAVSSVHR